MRHFLLVCFFVGTASAQDGSGMDGFNGPGELIQAFYANSKQGIQACGRSFVSGQDMRLPAQIRARNVDEVIVIEKSDSTLIPGVLVDWDIRNEDLELEYSYINGSLMLEVERDFDYNDIRVSTPSKGTFMRTNSYMTSGGVFTNYWIFSQHVSETQFRNTFHQKIVPDFVAYICK